MPEAGTTNKLNWTSGVKMKLQKNRLKILALKPIVKRRFCEEVHNKAPNQTPFATASVNIEQKIIPTPSLGGIKTIE